MGWCIKPETICSISVRKTVSQHKRWESRDESRELHRIGAGESSTSTTTNTNTSFAKLSTTKQTIAEM